MYEKIKKLLNDRIKDLNESYLKNAISEEMFKKINARLLKVQELMNEDKNLFSYIKIEIAYSILKDIGVPDNQISNTYIEIMKEIASSKKGYELIPPETFMKKQNK